jgi:hypothetical protein
MLIRMPMAAGTGAGIATGPAGHVLNVIGGLLTTGDYLSTGIEAEGRKEKSANSDEQKLLQNPLLAGILGHCPVQLPCLASYGCIYSVSIGGCA